MGARAGLAIALLLLLAAPLLPQGQDSGDSAAAETEAQRRDRLRREAGYAPGDSRIRVRGGEIAVSFPPLPPGGEAFRALSSARPGQVVPWNDSFAAKLTTDVDLDFGGSILRAQNQKRGFPGAYTLWLKRTAGGWSLVVNRSVDVWGTDHDPAADVAEIPLRHATTPGSEGPLRFAVSVSEGVLELRLSWGPHRWSTGARSAA